MSALEPQELPTADVSLDWVTSSCDDGLERARLLVEAFKRQPPSAALDVLHAWNDIHIALAGAAGIAGVYSEADPSGAVREAAEEAMQRLDAFSTELGMDREVFAILDGVDASGLDDAARRFLEHSLRDFRRSGVDRDDATRARLTELAELELKASQEHSKNIREGVRSISVPPEALAGMPQDWLDAHPAGDDGLVTVTTDYPDSIRSSRSAVTPLAVCR